MFGIDGIGRRRVGVDDTGDTDDTGEKNGISRFIVGALYDGSDG